MKKMFQIRLSIGYSLDSHTLGDEQNEFQRKVIPKLFLNLFKEVTATCIKLEADLFDSSGAPEALQVTPTVPVINVAAPVVHCASCNLPISEWKVNFDGDAKKIYRFFLERVTEFAQARGVSETGLFNSAVEFFSGDAFVWYRSIKFTVDNWGSLMAKLKKDFFHDDLDEELWNEIKRRKQRHGEPTVVFIAHLDALLSRLSRAPAEITKIKHIQGNLLPSFIDRLALHDTQSVSHLSELCRKLEEAEHLKNKNRNKFKEVVNTLENPGQLPTRETK